VHRQRAGSGRGLNAEAWHLAELFCEDSSMSERRERHGVGYPLLQMGNCACGFLVSSPQNCKVQGEGARAAGNQFS